MKKYILKNKEDFDMVHIFECGQCFRWNGNKDRYIGVVSGNVICIENKDNEIVIDSSCNENIENLVEEYFNIKKDYSKIKVELSKIDTHLAESIKYGQGIRILKQDVWETIISFIISANNNIPRIKKIIEAISKNYGKEIIYEGNTYYSFPTPEELSKASVQDLRALGLGFRDKRVYNTTKMIVEKQFDIANMLNEKNTEIVRENLLKLDGVGEKVADCILLFGFNRYEVFPVDVWVRRVVNELYIQNEDEAKVKKTEILELASKKFGKNAGLAQQYLFYYRREQK